MRQLLQLLIALHSKVLNQMVFFIIQIEKIIVHGWVQIHIILDIIIGVRNLFKHKSPHYEEIFLNDI